MRKWVPVRLQINHATKQATPSEEKSEQEMILRLNRTRDAGLSLGTGDATLGGIMARTSTLQFWS